MGRGAIEAMEDWDGLGRLGFVAGFWLEEDSLGVEVVFVRRIVTGRSGCR